MDKLGARLKAAEQPSDEDLALFRQIVGHCQHVLNGVQGQLEELGYDGPTPRVKTTGTLVDKLRRETARLSQVQDLAGARIIVADRTEQDEAVAAITHLFQSQGHKCELSDRLERPSHGYRALHVIVTIDQVNVEIQVRTELQDTWAQIIEDLADTWGRGIRYGDEPLNPDAFVSAGPFTGTRSEALIMLKSLSDNIATVEQNRQLSRSLSDSISRVHGLVSEISDQQAASLTIERSVPAIESTQQSAELFGLTPLILPDGWRSLAGVEALTLMRRSLELSKQLGEKAAERSSFAERQLRDTLQAIANATAEGE
jgi:ppGpp synthetase/RelA/SpoT-type nucleotidyltranferase